MCATVLVLVAPLLLHAADINCMHACINWQAADLDQVGVVPFRFTGLHKPVRLPAACSKRSHAHTSCSPVSFRACRAAMASAWLIEHACACMHACMRDGPALQVIKIGTSSLIHQEYHSLNLSNLARVCEVIKQLHSQGEGRALGAKASAAANIHCCHHVRLPGAACICQYSKQMQVLGSAKVQGCAEHPDGNPSRNMHLTTANSHATSLIRCTPTSVPKCIPQAIL